MIHADDGSLSQEPRLMRDSCRVFVDDVVTPFIRSNWQREWDMTPGDRLPPSILEHADSIGVRTLGVPEAYGGFDLGCETEVRTLALISEEAARGDSGLADKPLQAPCLNSASRSCSATQRFSFTWTQPLTSAG
jgi:hypothetical protein